VTKQLIAAFALSAITGAAAVAHPGHGQPGHGYTLVHYLTEPFHVIVGLSVIGAIVAGFALLRKRSRDPKRI
jgi:hypothetical protein